MRKNNNYQKMEARHLNLAKCSASNIIPADTWDQYEQLRLQRIRQQRQRMENMKDVVGQYSQIIADLEFQNKSLTRQLHQKNGTNADFNEAHLKNQELIANNKWMSAELERERMIRESHEQTITELRTQLIIQMQTDAKNHQDLASFHRNSTYSETLINRERDYETVLSLYSELKDELYKLQRQNFQLKDVIEHQSLVYYEKPEKTGQFSPEEGKFKAEKEDMKKMKDHPDFQGKLVRKIKQLKKQLKQQYQLIEKFKVTEDQQLKLIDSLKSQKTKICLCHYNGSTKKSAKRIKRQEQFKENTNQEGNM